MGLIGLAVLTFIGHKQTDKQTDKPNLYKDERKFLLFIDRTMINLLILENKDKTGRGWTCCNPTAFKFQRKPFWTKNAHNTQITLFFKVQNYWISVETFQNNPIIINDLFDSLVNTMLDSIWGGTPWPCSIVNGDTPGHFYITFTLFSRYTIYWS